MKSVIFIVITCLGFSAQAQLSNLPDLAGYTHLGRVALFKSVQKYSWMTPTAFESEFTCTTANTAGDSRTCHLKIFNRLSEAEYQKIQALAKKEDLGWLPFSALDTEIVGNIREQFLNMPADVVSDEMKTGTLQMAEGSFAYATYMIRGKKARIEQLLEDYQEGGLGQFQVSFDLNSQTTEIFLALQDGACLKKSLLALGEKAFSKYDVDRELDKVIGLCKLKHLNYDALEARTYMRLHLRATFFDFSKKAGFKLIPEPTALIGEKYFLQTDVGPTERLSCVSTLSLKAGSVPDLDCRSADGEIL